MAIRSLSQKHEKHHKRPDKEIVFAAVFFIAENLWSMGKWQQKKKANDDHNLCEICLIYLMVQCTTIKRAN